MVILKPWSRAGAVSNICIMLAMEPDIAQVSHRTRMSGISFENLGTSGNQQHRADIDCWPDQSVGQFDAMQLAQ
ncbi:hypothetical protein RHSP_06344 [Rhizobium freirei PRF 81]|uniref:Uncharacterized protein n=1 Tax=Rhizobium freirei PRF 81 TaxID=363754 RepID=N6UXW9_9HYPH|nr:hypothetical protein [Rhizobium freirei]ENN85596.1 hypothetical protein RHSP_06344 [Rhizobium freirei PRF 81]